MYPSIAHTRSPWIVTALITGSLTVADLSGGCSTLTRAGGASLEFVGHLISGLHDLSVERLDPMYPHCF